ncbi:MAG: 30S ribosomal protein S4e [Zestosphaera sp.]
MARKGGSRHVKSFGAPAFWPILRKAYKWTVKTSPGPHPINRSVPLLIIVRDFMGLAETSGEARKIIAEGNIKVDGRVRKDYKFPVGIMDVIEVVKTGEYFRVLPVPTKVLGLLPISEDEASFKLYRIENKTTVKGGHIQLNLHDGRNVLVRVSDPRNPAEDTYETLGTVKLSLRDGKIEEYYPMREGAVAIIVGGKNIGRVAKILKIYEGVRHYRKQVQLSDFKGSEFFTTLDKVFVLGSEKPVIKIPEGAV